MKPCIYAAKKQHYPRFQHLSSLKNIVDNTSSALVLTCNITESKVPLCLRYISVISLRYHHIRSLVRAYLHRLLALESWLGLVKEEEEDL